MSQSPITTFLLALTGSFLLAPGHAQQVETRKGPPVAPQPEPAKRGADPMRPFLRLVGHWQGEGTVRPEPAQPPMPWTSTSTYTIDMDGKAVREETRISFGEAMPGTLCFKTLYCWDPARKRHVAIAAANTGQVGLSEVEWAGPDTLVSAHQGFENTSLSIEHWVTKIEGDTMRLTGYHAVGTRPPSRIVEGRLTRVEDPGPNVDDEPGFGMPSAPEMARLEVCCGTFKVTGGMRMPEGPEIAIAGTNGQRMLWDGSVLELVTTGEPMLEMGGFRYRAWAAMAWDSVSRCYRGVWVNNMGEVGQNESRWVDGRLVTTSQALIDGQPVVMRHVLSFENGAPARAVAHAIVGLHEPSQVFRIDYQRSKSGKR